MPQQPSEQPHVAAARAENVDLRTRIRALAEEVATDSDAYVVDVQVRGQKGSRIVEVFLDADEGVGSDDLARLSRSLAFLLETEEVVKGKYYLNVSSPGAERPLVMPRQYRKHVGRTLQVTTGSADAESVRTGTLAAVRDDAFDLDVDGETETIPFADVTDARIQLPW
jgi:ribosome maturation factor RimP